MPFSSPEAYLSIKTDLSTIRPVYWELSLLLCTGCNVFVKSAAVRTANFGIQFPVI